MNEIADYIRAKAEHSHPPQLLLKVNEISETLRVTPSTVYRWIQTGKLEAVRFDHTVRVPTRALDKFLEEAAITQETKEQREESDRS